MRHQHLKLRRGHSTKAERRFAERLKRLRIPFKTKVMIFNREVDFIVGRYAIHVNGHPQDGLRNHELANAGWIPIHVSNNSVHQLTDSQLQSLWDK